VRTLTGGGGKGIRPLMSLKKRKRGKSKREKSLSEEKIQKGKEICCRRGKETLWSKTKPRNQSRHKKRRESGERKGGEAKAAGKKPSSHLSKGDRRWAGKGGGGIRKKGFEQALAPTNRLEKKKSRLGSGNLGGGRRLNKNEPRPKDRLGRGGEEDSSRCVYPGQEKPPFPVFEEEGTGKERDHRPWRKHRSRRKGKCTGKCSETENIKKKQGGAQKVSRELLFPMSGTDRFRHRKKEGAQTKKKKKKKKTNQKKAKNPKKKKKKKKNPKQKKKKRKTRERGAVDRQIGCKTLGKSCFPALLIGGSVNLRRDHKGREKILGERVLREGEKINGDRVAS